MYGVGGTESCYLKQSILYNITDWYSPEVSVHKTSTAKKTLFVFFLLRYIGKGSGSGAFNRKKYPNMPNFSLFNTMCSYVKMLFTFIF